MPEFNFCCARDDYSDLLGSVLKENNLQYLIDDYYTYPVKEFDDDVSPKAIERATAAKRTVYLVGDFTVNGVAFSREPYGPQAGMYSIDQTGMGPTVIFSFPTWFFDDGLYRIVPGYIQHHTKYCEKETETWHDANDALRAAYRAIKKTLQKQLKKVALVASPQWVSPLALCLMEQRKAAILHTGKWVTGPLNDLTITPCKWYSQPIRSS